MRRRHRRDRSRRRRLPDPQLPERARSAPAARPAGSSCEGLGLEREAPRVGEQAAALVPRRALPERASPTVVLDADQVALQLHESVGHPTELDRVLRHRGRLRRHELPQAGRPRLAALRLRAHERHRRPDDAAAAWARFAFDDEGVPAAPHADRRERRRSPAFSPRARLPPHRLRRRRLDARRRLEPDAARPHDEPPPRARRRDARRAARRRRRRRLPRDEQELVDRRQAPQLPVRHADRLGDQGRQARPHAARRDVHGDHAAVLGLAGRRRADRDAWRLYGITNCGKGQPGQSAHVSHGASPARFRDVQVGVRS